MADDSPIDSFLVEIGFSKPDAANARAQEDLVQRTEARITDIQARESAKRTEAEGKAQASGLGRLAKYIENHARLEAESRERRAAATAQALGELMGLDKEQSAQMLKHLREGSAKAIETEKDKVKRVAVVHNEQFKQLEAQAFRVASVLTGLGTGLGVALSATPFGAFLMGVERTASGLSNLAVQSQRVGASAAGIQRFLFSMRRQGVDEGQATGALEGFASTMKNNPEGYRQALARFGVKTIGPDGKPLDNDALLENFGQKLATEPLNIARIHAGQFGITGDDAINALRNPEETRRGLRAYDDKLSSFGFDPNKAAEDARKVQQSWDNLEADFKIIKQKLDAEFFLPMMSSLDALAKKLEENPQVVENYGRALEAMAIGVSARVLPVLTNLAVKAAGLESILGAALGRAVGIAVNPIVGLGASAESTPTAPVTTDPAERARKLANNTLPMSEWTAEEREAFSKKNGGGLWNWIKGKLGLGEGGSDGDRVKADIATTAEATRKLADRADGLSTPGGFEGGGGFGAGGGGVIGAARRTLGWAGRALGGGQEGRGGGPSSLRSDQQKANAASIADELRKAGAPDEGIAAVLGSMQTESSFSPRAHNDVTGGHTGLWQWDARRWPKVRAWIEKQGGDPWDARWQTKAYIAEGQAKPGDAIYDNEGTSGGFRDVMDSKGNLPKAVHGVQRSERFGVGEEGGRAAHALRWMGHLPSSSDAAPVAAAGAPVIGDQAALDAQNRIASGKGTSADRAIIEKHRQEQNKPAARGKPIPSFMAKDGTGEGITTIDYRDPKYGPHPDDDRISRARPSDVRYGARGFLSPVQGAHGGGDNALTQLYKDGALKVEVTKPLPGLANLKGIHELIAKHAAAGTLMPRSVHPLVSSGFINNIHHGNRNHFERHGDTFNIHGTDAKRGLDEAVKVSARRESQDRVRYGQG